MNTRLSSLTPVCALGFAFCFPIALQADTPPQIIDPPLAQFAWLGRSVTFKVSFTNNTPMTYEWQWNGARLPDATNQTFRLTSVALTNGGDYRVVLGNAAGVVTSAVARLTMRDWPQPTGFEGGVRSAYLTHGKSRSENKRF